MSLYKDASLVMLPSAYKDGKLLSIKPVAEYGSELNPNVDFSSDTDWSHTRGSWAISGGTLNTSSETDYCYVDIGDQSSKTLRVEFDIVSHSSGKVQVRLFGSTTKYGTARDAVGKYVEYIDVPAGHNGSIGFQGTSSFTGSIDNVSYKEVTSVGDFDFTRGSNLAATRVDVNGLIEKGRENLFTYSNDFSNAAWTKYNGVTLSGGESGYDGSNDAWLVTKPATSFTGVGQNVSSASGVITFSVYMKAGTLSIATIRLIGIPDRNVAFDLSNGTIFGGSSSLWIDRKIESVGGGWYKCSLTLANTGSTLAVIYPDEITDTTGGTIYIQDAQLEAGLVATDYIETGASTAQAGILEDMPRLDYSGGASCPALLLEPQRTNAVPYSEYFNTGWSKVGCSVTSNAAKSPEGLQNATKLVEDTSTGLHMLSYTNLYVVGAGDDNYLTLYAKEGERRYLAISSRGNFSNNDNTLIFDTRDGVWANNDSGQNTGQDPVDVGDGWWRIQILNDSISAAYDGFGIGIAEAGDNWDDASYTGDGSSGIYIWAAQAETGSYATSYIPTYGASVTRSYDNASITSQSDLIGQDSGTIFADFVYKAPPASVDYAHFAVQDSFYNNQVLIGGYNAALYARIYTGGTLTTAYNYKLNPTAGQRYKVAVAYDSESVRVFVNGEKKYTDTSVGTPTGTMDDVILTRGAASQAQISDLNQAVIFKTSLTDAECIALTE